MDRLRETARADRYEDTKETSIPFCIRLMGKCSSHAVRIKPFACGTTDGTQLAVLRGHTKEVNCIALSPRRLDAGEPGEEGQVFSWHLAEIDSKPASQSQPFPVLLMDLKSPVLVAAISPDGSTLAVSGNSKAIDSVPCRRALNAARSERIPVKYSAFCFRAMAKVDLTSERELRKWNLQTGDLVPEFKRSRTRRSRLPYRTVATSSHQR